MKLTSRSARLRDLAKQTQLCLYCFRMKYLRLSMVTGGGLAGTPLSFGRNWKLHPT